MKYDETTHEAWLVEKQDHRGELPTWWCASGSTTLPGGFVLGSKELLLPVFELLIPFKEFVIGHDDFSAVL